MTVSEYLEGLAEPRRTHVRQMHELIRETVPDLEPHMQNGMIGYGRYRYRYESGREGEWSQVALASNKQYLSLHSCACTPEGYLPEKLAPRLGKANVGKSCVRFKKPEDLDLDVVRELLRETALHFRVSDAVQPPG